MRPSLAERYRLLFYAFWMAIGFLQSYYTELLDDEAYYWVFSRFLDWGYFDHPPMTALLIKIGYALFANELGVRLLMVLLNTATIFICEQLLEQKNAPLFYAVCLSLAVLQTAGFMAVPDIPLLFFTALFFAVYKRFVRQTSLLNTVLLAVVMACLLYSKYHAVLVIFFALVSNLNLLRRWQIYAAGLLALLLYTPHLWWQYSHDWISFRYHLLESNVNPYKVSYTTDYLLGQLLIAGPLAGFILWPAVFRSHPQSATERALQYTGIGVFIFFLFSTFKGKVEANWTAPALIPIVVLGHQYLLRHPKILRWIFRLAPATVVLVIALRVVMIVDILPVKAISERFHQWQKWPQQLRQKTGGLPVVLSSSYQKASKYWFYSGQMTYSLNEYNKRRNNYNFWPIEDSVFSKPVYVFDGAAYPAADSMQTPVGAIRYALDSQFHSFAKVMIHPEKKEYVLNGNAGLSIRATVTFPYLHSNYLKANPQQDYPVRIGVFDKQKWLQDIGTDLSLQQLQREQQLYLSIQPDLKKGTYFLRFAIGSDAGWFTHNSDKIKLVIQ